MTTNPPILYILMRNDMSSMTSGRAIAQGSHAANHCVAYIKESKCPFIIDLLMKWENETDQYFGTAIVLGVSGQEMYNIHSNLPLNSFNGTIFKGITHDPEYAVRDGEVVHLIPLDTCMWIFGRKDDIKPFVEHLPLY